MTMINRRKARVLGFVVGGAFALAVTAVVVHALATGDSSIAEAVSLLAGFLLGYFLVYVVAFAPGLGHPLLHRPAYRTAFALCALLVLVGYLVVFGSPFGASTLLGGLVRGLVFGVGFIGLQFLVLPDDMWGDRGRFREARTGDEH